MLFRKLPVTIISSSLSLTGGKVLPVSRRAADEDAEDADSPTRCVKVLMSVSCTSLLPSLLYPIYPFGFFGVFHDMCSVSYYTICKPKCTFKYCRYCNGMLRIREKSESREKI